MDADRLNIEKTLQYMTLDEKIRMLFCEDVWYTFGVADLPRVRMAFGSNGLRLSSGNSTMPFVCYPSPSTLANSWDCDLIYNVGAALGEEATALGVNLLFAPSLNVKRSPLNGNNFDYYSEDPLLCGLFGKAFIEGVQSTGVGACVKYFGGSASENYKYDGDEIIDERALREIYLKPFEIALSAKPAAVMVGSDKVNGEYCGESEKLNETLRKAFNYDGVVISNWAGVKTKVKALSVGQDVELGEPMDEKIASVKKAIENGEVTEQQIDESLRRQLNLIDNVYLEPYGDYDADAHDELSYAAAVESVVLLKNDGVLPLTKSMRVAVIGALAENLPVEGLGKSFVTPTKVTSALDALSLRSIEVTYLKGYDIYDPKQNETLKKEAVAASAANDAVVVFVGSEQQSEGIDRTTLSLPIEQNELITELIKAGRKVVVALCSNGPVLMPWIKNVVAVLYIGYGGQNGALALIDALYGRFNPRGRLAETFPADESEIVKPAKQNVFKESFFTGYRHYDAIKRRTLFPFGYGLSYSNVTYDEIFVKKLPNGEYEVSVILTNLSARDGYEVVQVYVSNRTGRILCPDKQLAAFKKTFIEGKTTVKVTLRLSKDAFTFFDDKKNGYAVAGGEYKILVGSSAFDIFQEATVKVDGVSCDYDYPAAYKMPLLSKITLDDFKAIYGELPKEQGEFQKGEYTVFCSLNDIKNTGIGKKIIAKITKYAKNNFDGVKYAAFMNEALNMPLQALTKENDKFSITQAEGVTDIANGLKRIGKKKLCGK